MEHIERDEFYDDATIPAPASVPNDDPRSKSENQHDWGRGESLEPGGDVSEDEQESHPNEPTP